MNTKFPHKYKQLDFLQKVLDENEIEVYKCEYCTDEQTTPLQELGGIKVCDFCMEIYHGRSELPWQEK